jgi:hypothetical protein
VNTITMLRTIALGDVITLPDGDSLIASARVELKVPLGSMSGFIVAGELEVLLSLPATDGQSLLIYSRHPRIPENTHRVLAEGLMNYWAPHLPPLQGAMGEIRYRLVAVRGSIHPVVIIYRGSEVAVFIHSGHVGAGDLEVLTMHRGDTADIDIVRTKARVVARVPVSVPEPAYAAQPATSPATTAE